MAGSESELGAGESVLGGAGGLGHRWGWPGAATWMCGKLAESGGPAACTGVSREDEEGKGSSCTWEVLLVPPPLAAHGVQKPAPPLSLCLVGGEKPC